ncbi:unnamed protein product [Paramecium octaurelia]|uniref:Major facilitator superfamily (MFS) profile domain-containing protein n=1 Tax=Paramecium octaurelia TaxID=43137 RepID=A0A8S1TVP6_PAROT|nr:unnamed protein product [Paramecium octaurelia]
MNAQHTEFIESYIDQSNNFSKTKLIDKTVQNNGIHMKQQSILRYLVLFLSIWIIIPSFYCFDQPVAIYKTLQQLFQEDQTINFDLYFASLYIIYAFGNAFFPLFTGGMRDCHGDRIIMTYIVAIMIMGQLTFTIGVYFKSFLLMILGRLLLGCGIESLLPLWSSFLAPFFKNSISIVLSILQLFSQIGLVLSIYLTPIIQKQYNLMTSLISGIVFILFGYILLCLGFLIDKKLENENYLSSYRQLQPSSDIILTEDTKIINKLYFFKFKDFKIFPQMFWLLLAFNSMFFCSIVTLVNVSIYIMASVLFDTNNQIEELDIALFWMLGCLSLFIIGPLVQYFTYRRYLIIVSVIIIIIGHIQYLTSPHIGLIILAVGYCLSFVCTWSAIIYIIKLKSFGKAFGLTVGFQNLIFVFMPFLLDVVNRNIMGTFKVLISFSLFALILAIQILVEDIRCFNILDNKLAPMQFAKINNVSNEENNNNDTDLFAEYLEKPQ